MKLRTSSSHEEGAIRDWAITTKRFLGEDGKLTGMVAIGDVLMQIVTAQRNTIDQLQGYITGKY
jgi:glutamate synthase (NADPH/NADH) small chain